MMRHCHCEKKINKKKKKEEKSYDNYFYNKIIYS